MIKYFVIAALSIATSIACKSKKAVTEVKGTTDTVVEISPLNPQDSIRLSVSFFSPGSGINRDAYKKLERHIELFEEENGIILTIYKVPWGREGEVDFCFKLSTIDNKKAEAFVTSVKNLLAGAEKVNIKENCSCRYWPQR